MEQCSFFNDASMKKNTAIVSVWVKRVVVIQCSLFRLICNNKKKTRNKANKRFNDLYFVIQLIKKHINGINSANDPVARIPSMVLTFITKNRISCLMLNEISSKHKKLFFSTMPCKEKKKRKCNTLYSV